MHKPNTNAIAVDAIALAVGFFDFTDRNAMFDRLSDCDQVVVELYSFLACAAVVSDAAFERRRAEGVDVAGVWAYDVSEPAGKWIAAHFWRESVLPSTGAVTAQIEELASVMLAQHA
ncbi:hypothetical protein [Burkholderia gladioli]|uniref:hypothetical protein n=1 Tax=Burkholderia gladioli TaxID=28095 RepID=UPI00163FEE04|nr:hypothetical protein [Burkholderia gladioli]